MYKKMNDPKPKKNEYLRFSIINLIKSKILFAIILTYEFLDLITNLVDQIIHLFYLNKFFNQKNNDLSNILLSISPYNYFHIKMNEISYRLNAFFRLNFYLICIYLILLILFIGFLYMIPKTTGNEDSVSNSVDEKGNIFLVICINFFEYIFFRVLVIYIFDLISREILKFVKNKNYAVFDLVLLFCSVLIYLIIIFFHYIYFTSICVWSNIHCVDKEDLEMSKKYFPFDCFFSNKNDVLLLIIKALIAFNKNYEYYDEKNNIYINYVSIFLITSLLIIFYGYILYLIFLIFISNQCLFLIDNFYNKFRLFYLLFTSEVIFLRIILSENRDFKIFLFFTFIFLIFDIFLIFIQFSKYLYFTAIKSENFIGVCWFLHTSEIDIDKFIIEFITNHKRKCNDNKCPICSILINDDNENLIIISTEKNANNEENLLQIQKNKINKKLKETKLIEFEEINNLFKGNPNSNKKNKKKDEQKFNNTNIINDNLLLKLFSIYKFNNCLINIINNSVKNKNIILSKNDIIRLDYINLSTLFLSNQNIKFPLFNKICQLLFKYHNNVNIEVSLRLLFDISRKLNQKTFKDYDLYHKNEDLRSSLKDYITEFENFIHFSSKTPENYLKMARKFRMFKNEVKLIHTIFKKNVELNYQLSLIRYMYESIVHFQTNNNNHQIFDLNIYADFLESHYENDKTLLIKYVIDSGQFYIIKCSKEFLKYQNKNIEEIFPDIFKKMAVEKLFNQLNNNGENQQKIIVNKPRFEFIMKDLNKFNFGYIESFKMQYYIYPTNDYNILLMQVGYINSYAEMIIFEISKNGNEELYSFSYKLFKYFGLTPNTLQILRRRGKTINSTKMFVRKIEENSIIYTLNYSIYVTTYQKIIKNDALLDLPNHSELEEKLNEIKFLAEKNREIHFYVNFKGKYSYKGREFNFYSIKENKKKYKTMKETNLLTKQNNSQKGINDESENEGSDSENDSDFFKNQFNNKGLANINSMVSTQSFSDISSLNSINNHLRGKQNDKEDKGLNMMNDINNYNILILIYSIVLIILTTIFLILEVTINNNFKTLFKLFGIFKQFKFGIESSPLSLISNFKFYRNESFAINKYEEYSNKLKNQSNLLKILPGINEIIKKQINQNYAEIIQYTKDYEIFLFSLKNKVSLRVRELSGYSYDLKITSENLKVYKVVATSISIFREYNNYISTLILNDAFANVTFPLFTFQSTKNSTIYSLYPNFRIEFNEISKDMLLIFLTYPSLHIDLTESSYFIQQGFHNAQSLIEKILIIFFILLFVLNMFLVIICFLFLIAFVNIIKVDVLSSNKLFSDKKYVEMQTKRLEQFKIMTNLYSENPIKIVRKIELIEEKYKRKTRIENSSKKDVNQNALLIDSINEPTEEKKPSNNNISLDNNKEKEIDNDDENIPLNNKKNSLLNQNSFNEVAIKYRIILIIFFVIYFTYCIIYFIFVVLAEKRLGYLVLYCEINTRVDEYIYDNFNTLIYLYTINCTENFYGSIIYGNSSVKYLDVGLNNLYKAIEEKEDFEKNHKNLFPTINNYININCSDENFFEDSKFSFLGKNYKEYIKGLCEFFPVMKSGNDIAILYEISYKFELLYRQFQKLETFIDIYDIFIDNQDLYESYTLILFFNKMIRDYFNEKLFLTLVNDIFGYFSWMIVVYLVLSVVFEIALFLILCCILKQIKSIHQLLSDFSISLKL